MRMSQGGTGGIGAEPEQGADALEGCPVGGEDLGDAHLAGRRNHSRCSR